MPHTEETRNSISDHNNHQDEESKRKPHQCFHREGKQKLKTQPQRLSIFRPREKPNKKGKEN